MKKRKKILNEILICFGAVAFILMGLFILDKTNPINMMVYVFIFSGALSLLILIIFILSKDGYIYSVFLLLVSISFFGYGILNINFGFALHKEIGDIVFPSGFILLLTSFIAKGIDNISIDHSNSESL